jgi:hypothetical protein
MGNHLAPPPVDDRVQKNMKRLTSKQQEKHLSALFENRMLTFKPLFENSLFLFCIVPEEKIVKLWHIFSKYDRIGQGYVVLFASKYFLELHHHSPT